MPRPIPAPHRVSLVFRLAPPIARETVRTVFEETHGGDDDAWKLTGMLLKLGSDPCPPHPCVHHTQGAQQPRQQEADGQ